MAAPQSLLRDVRGIGRDFAIDSLPPAYVWDLIDYIPNRRGARLEGRGPWKYFSSSALAGDIWGGKHATFDAGSKLLICGGGNIYDHPLTVGAPTSIGTMFATGLQNGVLLRNRVYFADGAGAAVPKYVTWNGTAFSIASLGASAPKPKIIEVYKDRLIAAADPAHPQRVSFSPLEIDGGPPGVWDAISFLDTSRAVTALAPMGSQILAFHAKSIEKVRGSIPPGAGLDTDMFLDLFSDQMGCADPSSVVNWQENVIFTNSRGVHLTDGATIRSLTDQGSMGDFWRTLYSRKKAGTRVSAGVFLDYLFVTILTDYSPTTPAEDLPITLVCNLNDRTWFRFSNYYATCYIESETGTEEVWSGVETVNKLTRISDTFYGNLDLPEAGVTPPAALDAVDGNGKDVLPLLDLGWRRLGPEGVKRLQHVYVSHQTQRVGFATNVFQVDYQTNVGTAVLGDTFSTAGVLPNQMQYTRNRLNIGKRGYGIRVVVRQIAPTYLSRLYDVQMGEWAQDKGKL